jgi:hypothetical protein
VPSPLSPDDLDPLRAYATPRQAEYLDAIAEHGSVGKAAGALGIDRRLIFGALARLRGNAGSVPGAPDAWTASMGYRSGRDMHAVTLHAEHGEVIRQRVDPAMLADVA